VLQCATVCYSKLQCIAVVAVSRACGMTHALYAAIVIAECCSVLKCVAVIRVCAMIHVCARIHALYAAWRDSGCVCVAVRCCVLQCVAVCCSVLQCVAVCCSVLQWYVAVCCSDSHECHGSSHVKSFESPVTISPGVLQ